jgi:hypothetical protein
MIRQTTTPESGAVQTPLAKICPSNYAAIASNARTGARCPSSKIIGLSAVVFLVSVRIDDGLEAVRIQIAIQGLGCAF